MRCTQAVLAELICVELKEMGRATLNKHIHSFVFLTQKAHRYSEKNKVLPVLERYVPHIVECTQVFFECLLCAGVVENAGNWKYQVLSE